MSSMNKVIIAGRLGQDPETKTVSSGKTVARMSVATSEKWTDREGQRHEKTEWHRVVVWGELAVHCERYLQKGSLIAVEGRLETRSWEDDKQVTHYTTEIIAKEIKFFTGLKQHNAQAREPNFEPSDEIPF